MHIENTWSHVPFSTSLDDMNFYIIVTGLCAHNRAYEYFAESIGNPWGFRATNAISVFMGGRELTK